MTTRSRRDQLQDNLNRTREAIVAASSDAGRASDSVRLIAVTKTFPAADAAALVDLGQADLGENRDQEAAPKAAELAAQGREPVWHFVGRLQRNKARSVASYAHWVHSVDRVPLADALDAAATAHGRRLNALVQVSLDGDVSRGGTPVAEVEALAERIAAAPSLVLKGVMAVAPLGWEPGKAFALLAECAEKVRSVDPAAAEVSAGMSGDFAAAIAAGATMVRLGRNVLGEREPMA
ncbi:YggS family pyridoxal phosphate-dependent enzyme [Glycomyces sp. TRM65418]|uniref:YggS family pyridoxal phosphate-dependent enzyme n=1 Tax=Glycomyces sp. TRM65418 TaxID=2867006 RepID=UPI001CE4FE95|nr:YggS family pyridoxal phosphate-dependent enzyme [Glycomyces sp. TRM65418]MCC3762070.1 YggS family pyridoxal phosphate-dependent enzyme [Glycomyces sp. TRM65418]QZD56140.1 YggS family pyridoxal phosphate-dependent enzyme [Glycomyces sp. TRM65418]